MFKPTPHQTNVNGAKIAYLEYGQQQPDQPTLVFVHATGFHSRVWDYLIAALPDLHVIAVDQRGHGRSENLAVTNWQTFGQDLAELLTQLHITRGIGIGHSMGGHSLIDGASKSGSLARLLLLDPTVGPPDQYVEGSMFDFDGELHPASKRRASFSSVEEMLEQISTKSSFPLFHPQILHDYCQHALVTDTPGQLTLACPPVIEAQVYMSARSNTGVFDSVAQLSIPVRVVRAKMPAPDQPMDFSSSPTWPGLADMFTHGSDIHWPDCSHFIPMQRPQAVVELIEEEVANWRVSN